MSELYTKVAEQRGNDPLSVAVLGCVASDNPSLPIPSGGYPIVEGASPS